jgi:predicted membrane-bound dolichyl-phosphate-mannose-protein mannosyltransferase
LLFIKFYAIIIITLHLFNTAYVQHGRTRTPVGVASPTEGWVLGIAMLLLILSAVLYATRTNIGGWVHLLAVVLLIAAGVVAYQWSRETYALDASWALWGILAFIAMICIMCTPLAFRRR